jgi:hypothetical protein
MIKTDLARQCSQLAYGKPSEEPTLKPQEDEQRREPETGRKKPKRPKRPKEISRLQSPPSPPPKPTIGPPKAPRPPPSTPTTGQPLSEFLTRRQAADYVRDELGRPMSFSTASKLAAQGEFAKAALWWGRRPLYTRSDLRVWAQARSRPTKEIATETTTQGEADCCTAQQGG